MSILRPFRRRSRPPRLLVTAVVVAGLMASLLLAACGGGSSGDDEAAIAAATVTTGPRTTAIEKNKFETPMRVTAGSEVTWVNEDGVAHNVIAKDGSFKSGKLDKDDRFSHTLTSAGRFEYTCTFHPGMNGVIQVE